MKSNIAKTVSALTVFLLLVLMSVACFSAMNPAIPDWTTGYLEYWAELGIINGYGDGELRPERNINRAEVAASVSSIMDLEYYGTHTYYDVPVGHWAHDSIEAATAYGAFNGLEGFFRPSSGITKEELFSVLYRITRCKCDNPSEILGTITDSVEISPWAEEAVAAMIENGIATAGRNGKIDPGRMVTRGEFAVYLYRIEKSDLWNDLKRVRNLTAVVGGAQIRTQLVDGEAYLFLPSFTDLGDLHVCYSDDGMTSAEALGAFVFPYDGILNRNILYSLDVISMCRQNDDGIYQLKLNAESEPEAASFVINIMKSSNLPAVFLSSDEGSGGRPFIEQSKDNEIGGSMLMVSDDGKVIYDGMLERIKARGNSTFGYTKKPYNIKLGTKYNLIGNGKRTKTWVLLANYAEATMFKDKICKDLALEMKLPGSTASTWVDLYFDGLYRGCYCLSEKIKISDDLLDITDLEKQYENSNPDYGKDVTTNSSKNKYDCFVQYVEGINDPDDTSNGYLLEASTNTGDENVWFKTRRGWAMNVISPENLSETTALYISELWQEFEDAVYGTDSDGNPNGINPNTGKSYTEYCDLESLARLHLIYYFGNNQDSYALSTYYYYENGIFHAGPFWDGDQTFGIGWISPTSPSSDMRMHYMIEALYKLESFRKKVVEVFESEFVYIAEAYSHNIPIAYSRTIAASEKMNHRLWPVYYSTSGLYEAYPPEMTYDEIVELTVGWMGKRLDYMKLRYSMWKAGYSTFGGKREFRTEYINTNTFHLIDK